MLLAHSKKLVAFGCALILAFMGMPSGSALERSVAELMDVLMWNREQIGGPFALVDHTGQQRTDADFRGKLLVIYFGFTYCPDICPTDLQSIGLAVDQLGEAGQRVQPLFVTLDPERDTPEHLREYVQAFHPRLVGLTGAAEAIREAAAAYKVFYAKAPGSSSGDYSLDHTGFIYLVGSDGQYRGFLPPGTGENRIAQVLKMELGLPVR